MGWQRWACLLLIAVASACWSAEPADVVAKGQEARKQRLLHLVNMAQLQGLGRKNSPYDILAFTAANGCGPSRLTDFMADLAGPGLNPNPQEPIEMFALPPLVRYLFQFGACLSEAQKTRLLEGLTRPQRLFGQGTINHAALQSSSWYLLAQFFPEATWHDFDGKPMDSAQLMARLKPMLQGRVGAFYQQGHLEWLSPTYAVVNLFPMLNLADFAKDPQVRSLGDAEALLEVSLLKAHSFHGMIVPPLTRKNAEQHNGPEFAPDESPSVAQHVLWFYFGEPSDLSGMNLRSKREPMYAVMLVLSNWRPPAVLNGWDEALKRGYRIRTVTPQFASWGQLTGPYILGDAFISDAYALSAGQVFFNPAGYEEHIQAFGLMYRSDDTYNQVPCYQPYFNSNLGEDAWDTDRWSPFQQVALIDNQSAVLLYSIPAKDPWGRIADTRHVAKRSQHRDALLSVFQCRVSVGMDSVSVDGHGVYLREGSTWMALLGLHGAPEVTSALGASMQGYRAVKWRQAQGAIFVFVQPDAPGMDVAAFKALVARKAPRFDLASMSVKLPADDEARTGIKRIAFAAPDPSLAQVPRWSRVRVEVKDDASQKDEASAPVSTAPSIIQLKGGVLNLTNPLSKSSQSLTVPFKPN